MSDLFLDAALAYAAENRPVFPLQARGKKPLIAGGFHNATTDRKQITAWWTRWPTANIGMPCGAKTFCVIDIDPLKGGGDSLQALKEEHGSIPETLLQITGSGGGHYCFLPDTRIGNSESKIAPGIDTRGNDKGYIVVAPSIHPNGTPYRWDNPGAVLIEVPEWLIPPVEKRKTAVKPLSMPAITEFSEVIFRARAYLQHCEPAIQGQGGHAKLLWAATCMVWGYELSDTDAFRLLAEEYNPKCVPPWNLGNLQDAKEFKRKIQEGRKEKRKPKGWLLEEYHQEQDIVIEHGRKIAANLLRNMGSVAAQVEDSAITETDNDIPEWLLYPPGLLGDVCKWTNSRARKKQPFLTLANSLAFLGALFGRKVRDEWDLRTNVYCLGIGVSSCGKDNSRRSIKDLCAKVGISNDLLGGEDATSDAALMACIDERPSCLFQWDEIGHMIAGMKDRNASAHRKTIVPMLMKLYSSANTVFLGKEYAENARKDLVQPNVCLYGTTVPDVLYRGLTTAEIRDGFLGRMLVFISTDNDPDIDDFGSQIDNVPAKLIEQIGYWFRYVPAVPQDTGDIKGIANRTNVGQVTFRSDHDAHQCFQVFRKQIRKLRKESLAIQDGVDSLWGRAEESARKIALILAASNVTLHPVEHGIILNDETAIITLQHAEYACALVRYLVDTFIVVAKEAIADSDEEQTAKQITKIIRTTKKTGIRHRDLTRKTQQISARKRDDIIRNLTEGGLIIKTRKPGSGVWWYFCPPHGLEYLTNG